MSFIYDYGKYRGNVNRKGLFALKNRNSTGLSEFFGALSFGGRSLEFRDMVVTIEGDKLVPYAGNIGMALVNQFEKVAINFNDCFVVFE